MVTIEPPPKTTQQTGMYHAGRRVTNRVEAVAAEWQGGDIDGPKVQYVTIQQIITEMFALGRLIYTNGMISMKVALEIIKESKSIYSFRR